MQLAEIPITLCRLPAFIVFALANPHHVGLVLSEVESFPWVDFRANCFVKVLIRDLPVLVVVEFVEDVLELFFCQVKAPVLEIELQLFWLYATTLFFIQIYECLSNCFPLELYLVYDRFLQVLTHQTLTHFQLLFVLLQLVFLVFLKLGVLN